MMKTIIEPKYPVSRKNPAHNLCKAVLGMHAAVLFEVAEEPILQCWLRIEHSRGLHISVIMRTAVGVLMFKTEVYGSTLSGHCLQLVLLAGAQESVGMDQYNHPHPTP